MAWLREMNVQDRLRQQVDEHQDRLRAEVPADGEAAILALISLRDRHPHPSTIEPPPDLVTGRRIADLGGNKALQLCLESTADNAPTGSAPMSIDGTLVDWAARFWRECGELAEAEQVLAHCASGFMRIVEDADGRFDAWIATKRAPTSWRERADIAWWASSLARLHAVDPDILRSGQSAANDPGVGASRLGARHALVQRMTYQLGYPSDAVIGGCTIQTYRDVLARLIGRALAVRDQGEPPATRSGRALVAALASDLGIDPGVVDRVVAAFTLDRENAAYHAAVPGIAAAPLVRVTPDRIVWSVHGLTTEPLLFLARELRRRDAQEYHNVAHLREGVFRQDLHALFHDKRFVTSAGRIELRRARGDIRTDIDAVVFDRKTGTLGVFELKSQEPYARSVAEQVRQRDNMLYANRQVSGVLDWIKRHGADEVLSRVDARTAKTFRVHKVYPFVLGRYLAHFSDGAEPDRRAAWGTWPQVLRVRGDERPGGADANPIASLFNRLKNDAPLDRPPLELPPQVITIGTARLVVHPTFAAFREGAALRDPS